MTERYIAGGYSVHLAEGAASPWGPIQIVEPIAEGIAFVSTDRHGGFCLDAERLAAVDRSFPNHRLDAFAAGPWFEEDCRAAYVVATFPEHFQKDAHTYARGVLQRFYSIDLGDAPERVHDLKPREEW